LKTLNVVITDQGHQALRKVKEAKNFRNLSETVDFIAVYAVEKIVKEET